MIAANRIEFRGYSSVDFNLKTCIAFESDNGEVDTYLTRESVASESYRGEFKRINNFKYTETFNPKFTFIKDDFGDFSTEEVRKVLRWLTSGTNASFLTVYKDDSNVVHFEILGGFSEVSLYKLGNGRCVGFTATFESAHPYAFSPLRTITVDASKLDERNITINIETDEPEAAIYPRITIQQYGSVVVPVDRNVLIDFDRIDGTVYYWEEENTYYYDEDGTPVSQIDVNPVNNDTKTSVMIKNRHVVGNDVSEYTLKIKNNTAGEKVVVDGANRVISSSHTRIFGDDFIEWNWLPLFDGKNNIEVVGNCLITFQYREVWKIGEF